MPTIILHEPVQADTCEQLLGSRWAQFEGTYRSQETTSALPGQFNVLVFDQGEPGVGDPASSPGTGSPSSSPVFGPYAVYTRAGYIEGGNIQVDN